MLYRCRFTAQVKKKKNMKHRVITPPLFYLTMHCNMNDSCVNKHSHHNIEKSAMIKSSACTSVEPKKKIWPLHSCNTSTHVLCLSQCMPLILFDPHSHIFQREKKIPDYFCNIIIVNSDHSICKSSIWRPKEARNVLLKPNKKEI
jgi:hypothetical protein